MPSSAKAPHSRKNEPTEDPMPIIGQGWWMEFGIAMDAKLAAYKALLIANQRFRQKVARAGLRLSEIGVHGEPLPLDGDVGQWWREDLKNTLLSLDLYVQQLQSENELLANSLAD